VKATAKLVLALRQRQNFLTRSQTRGALRSLTDAKMRNSLRAPVLPSGRGVSRQSAAASKDGTRSMIPIGRVSFAAVPIGEWPNSASTGHEGMDSYAGGLFRIVWAAARP
jgi:hypothetical protein